MPLNTERIGHHYPAYRYSVGREHVREYAIATGVTDARYLDDRPDAEPGPLPVPPAYVACITGARAWHTVMADPQLGAHDRLMHGGQEFEFARPVMVGDELVCTPVIADVRSMRGLDLLTLEVRCTTPGGEPVVVSRARLAFLPEPS